MEGDELRKKRTVLGLTQAELAEILGVKPNTIARWERGLLPVPRIAELAMQTVERTYKKKGNQ
jgi:transcriptional regulator with XRE-family HTH domain